MPGPGPYGNKRRDAVKWLIKNMTVKGGRRPSRRHPRAHKKLKWKG